MNCYVSSINRKQLLKLLIIKNQKSMLYQQLMHFLHQIVPNNNNSKQFQQWHINYMHIQLFLCINQLNNISQFNNIIFIYQHQIMISQAQRSNKKLKNLSCLAFSFVLLFTTSIFVSQTYYNKTIDQSITQASILKDNQYTNWGKMLPNSNYVQKFTPYVYDDQLKPVLSSNFITYNYAFEYKNISFAQGVKGDIRYLNTWQRVRQNNKFQEQNIKVINLQAEKVFNYDYFAPGSRKFALMFNVMFKTLSEDFVDHFYSEYVFEYFFKNQKMVQNRIFNLLSFTEERGKQIYENSKYGLNSNKALQKWIQLNKYFRNDIPFDYPQYNNLAKQLNLKDSQISFIAGATSTLSNLLTAVNGSIKYKLWSRNYNYECEGMFCSNQILAASQLAFGFLTADSLFKQLNLNKFSSQINKTLLNNIEYSWFCSQNADLTCMDPLSAIQFYSKNYLSNYSQVDFIFKSLDKPEVLQNRYQLPEQTGKSLIAYVLYLYNNVFNIPITNTLNLYIDQSKVNYEPLKVSFTNFNHIQKIMDSFGDIVVTELYSRGLKTRFIEGTETKCQDYYTGDSAILKDRCQTAGLDLTKDVISLKNYVSAYFGISTKQFKVLANMTSSQTYTLLHSDNSKFAVQMKTMIADMIKNYQCTQSCSRQELLVKEWTQGSILSNLPKEYFINPTANLSDWDRNNMLNGYQPQLSKYTKFKIAVSKTQAYYILNSNTGIFSLYNLMRMNNQPSNIFFQGIKNSDLLTYLQDLVLNVDFKGTYLNKPLGQYFGGYNSEVIKQKQLMNKTLGGASWLNEKISAIQLKNQPTKFDIMNSGIYSQIKLRAISQIQDNKFSSSQYQIYKSQNEDISKTYLTNKHVGGSNLFGFSSRLNTGDSIQGYMDFMYGPAILSYISEQKWKNQNNDEIAVYRYQFKDMTPVKIDIQELSNRTVQVSKDSYFLVQPTTGLTCEFLIKYTIYTKPFYLQLSGSGQPYPIYAAQFKYLRPETAQIFQINSQQNTLSTLLLLSIILASVSMITFIVLIVLYEKKSKSIKKNTLNSMESLITEQISGSLKKNQYNE